jgi:hypothetical protein
LLQREKPSNCCAHLVTALKVQVRLRVKRRNFRPSVRQQVAFRQGSRATAGRTTEEGMAVVLGLSVRLRAWRESSDGKACGFSRTRFVVTATMFNFGTAAEDFEGGI